MINAFCMQSSQNVQNMPQLRFGMIMEMDFCILLFAQSTGMVSFKCDLCYNELHMKTTLHVNLYSFMYVAIM